MKVVRVWHVQENSKITHDFIIAMKNITGVLGGVFPASIFVVELEVERRRKRSVPEGTSHGVTNC